MNNINYFLKLYTYIYSMLSNDRKKQVKPSKTQVVIKKSN